MFLKKDYEIALETVHPKFMSFEFERLRYATAVSVSLFVSLLIREGGRKQDNFLNKKYKFS